MKRALGWVVNFPYLNSEFPLVCFNNCFCFCFCFVAMLHGMQGISSLKRDRTCPLQGKQSRGLPEKSPDYILCSKISLSNRNFYNDRNAILPSLTQ